MPWDGIRSSKALNQAVDEGDVESARLLASNPETPQEDLDRALRRAGTKGHSGLIEALLGLGADPFGQSEEGADALMWAALSGSAVSVEALIAVSNLVAMDNFGRTALFYAAASGRREALMPLLAVQDAGLRDKEGEYPVAAAAQKGAVESIMELLAQAPESAQQALEVARSYFRREAEAAILAWMASRREKSDLELCLPVEPPRGAESDGSSSGAKRL